MNTFGNIYRLTSFGESHGPAVGGVIDGLPPSVIINLEELQQQLDRRRPGASRSTSSRHEDDKPVFLSGLMDYKLETGEIGSLTSETKFAITLGTPVGFYIENRGARSADYDALRSVFRPSHADYAWQSRYGIRDWRGGGRASGRETAARVVCGAMAMQLLKSRGISVSSRICSIGEIGNPTQQQIDDVVALAKADSDSVGGVLECIVSGLPAGIGEPTFGKLQQMLASAMMSVGAVKGFEYGMGFSGVSSRGSEVADEWDITEDGRMFTRTNYSGGIQGGISNGMDIVFKVAIKPTPTISKPLQTVNAEGRRCKIEVHGRHDPCILMRIPVVIESMAAMVILDALLMRGAGNFSK